jgi:hypothetical protein
MRMACSRGHFLICIREDIRKDHKRCSTFSWNPNGFFVWTRNNPHQNNNGWWPHGKLKLNDLLEAPKEKSGWDKDGRRLFGDSSKCLLKHLLLVSFNEVIKIPLSGCDHTIDHGHIFWKLHDLLKNYYFSLPFCSKFLLARLYNWTPRAYEFFLKVGLMAFF